MWSQDSCLCLNVLSFQCFGEKNSPVLLKTKCIWIEITNIFFRKWKWRTNRLGGCHHHSSLYWNVLLYLLLIPPAGNIGKNSWKRSSCSPEPALTPVVFLAVFFSGDFLAGPTQIASFPPKRENLQRQVWTSAHSFFLLLVGQCGVSEQRNFDQW